MPEQCPYCGSYRCRHNIEADSQGHVTADYWVCEECHEGWSYEQQRQPAAEEE